MGYKKNKKTINLNRTIMNTKTICLKNGTNLMISLNDNWDCIEFYYNGNKIDGKFEFKDESPEEDMTDFLIKTMYSPRAYIRQGVGKEVLDFFRTETDCKCLYARPNDGITRADGSHLTENAPDFVKAMTKKGLINYQK